MLLNFSVQIRTGENNTPQALALALFTDRTCCEPKRKNFSSLKKRRQELILILPTVEIELLRCKQVPLVFPFPEAF